MDNELLAKLTKTIEDTSRKTIEEANKKQSIEIKEHINSEIRKLKQEFEKELIRSNNEWERKYTELKTKCEKLEKDLKKNNIIIFGLENPPDQLENFVVNALNEYLGLTLTVHDINNAYTIGKQSDKKPIIVKFLSYFSKLRVLQNVRKLKGSSISIAEDLNFEERKANRILRRHLHKAQSKKLKAFIKKGKLVISGQGEYSADQLAEKEEFEAEEIELNNAVEDYEPGKSYRDNCASPTPGMPANLNHPNQKGEEAEDVSVTGKVEKDPKRKRIVKPSTEASQKITRKRAEKL